MVYEVHTIWNVANEYNSASLVWRHGANVQLCERSIEATFYISNYMIEESMCDISSRTLVSEISGFIHDQICWWCDFAKCTHSFSALPYKK